MPAAPEAATANRYREIAELWQLVRLAPVNIRRGLAPAIILAVLATLADIVALGLLGPALKAATSVASVGRAHIAPSLTAFFAAAVVSSALRLISVRRTVTVQYKLASGLAVAAFEGLQRQTYADYLRIGASEGFAAFDRLQLLSFHAVVPLIAGTTAALSAVLLLVGLTCLHPVGGVLFLALAILLGFDLVRPSPNSTQTDMSRRIGNRARLLHESRVAFRDIYLTNGQDRMLADFAEIDHALRMEQATAVSIAQSTRHTLELAGFALVFAGLLALNWLGAEAAGLIPMLGVIALSSLRLLPQVATVRSALRQIASQGSVTRDVIALLEPRRAGSAPTSILRLRDGIQLSNIRVSRDGRQDPLQDLSLTIRRGARIGIAGASGAGKSTLLDVISGAIQPDSGSVTIDSTVLTHDNAASWRERIGFVSQNPLLLGRTLREAVAFPDRLDSIDRTRFDRAVALSGIERVSETFSLGLDTPVGEAIEHLSGGQRQRLALAHALYRARDLLLLDEVSGQLDGASELALVEAIQSLPRELTIVIVSHRPALFARCDTVYALEDGRLLVTPGFVGAQ